MFLELISVQNLSWMGWNVMLALLGLLTARLFVTVRHGYMKTAVAVLWMLFVPNTIYLLTDTVHLFRQWPMTTLIERLVLMLQYGVLIFLGMLTYIRSMGWVELGFYRWARKGSGYLAKIFTLRSDVLFAGLNYLIAFGVIMGRFFRTNSWEVFTNPLRVASDVWGVVTSLEMMVMVTGVFILTQTMYVSLKRVG